MVKSRFSHPVENTRRSRTEVRKALANPEFIRSDLFTVSFSSPIKLSPSSIHSRTLEISPQRKNGPGQGVHNRCQALWSVCRTNLTLNDPKPEHPARDWAQNGRGQVESTIRAVTQLNRYQRNIRARQGGQATNLSVERIS